LHSTEISIIIPTYNESENICPLLKSISENLPKNSQTEAIVVNDNSPDGTAKIGIFGRLNLPVWDFCSFILLM